jgi:hypothetical protein
MEIFLNNKSSLGIFLGILINTGAARTTAGENQFRVLQKVQNIKLNRARTGELKVKFRIGRAISIGTIEVDTPIGTVTFHVIPGNTLFLLSHKDLMDYGAYYNNLKSVLV